MLLHGNASNIVITTESMVSDAMNIGKTNTAINVVVMVEMMIAMVVVTVLMMMVVYRRGPLMSC